MATGDITIFNQFVDDLANKTHNLKTDTFKLGFITSAVTPAAADTTPMWSVGSGKDYDGNEVVATGNYTAGGITIGNPTFSFVGGAGKWDDNGTNISLAQHGSGFTNARWGIIYNDTATNNEAVAFVDFGGDLSEVAGPISMTWHAGGILITTIVP